MGISTARVKGGRLPSPPPAGCGPPQDCRWVWLPRPRQAPPKPL